MDHVREILLSRNAVLPSEIVPDGRIIRCPDKNKQTERDVAFMVRPDGSGWVENHRDGRGREDFQPPDCDCIPSASELERKQEERAIDQSRAAEAARAEYDASPELIAPHPYLERKRVHPANGLRIDSGGNLLVPMKNSQGKVSSLQRISESGGKKFFTGASTVGLFFIVGDPKSSTVIVMVEGLATGLTIHGATGLPVVVAFNCGNLLPVAKTIRARRPHARIIFAADDDAGTEERTGNNPGIEHAKHAAKEVDGIVVIPDFGSQRPAGASDFNDLASHLGPDAVKDQIRKATLERAGKSRVSMDYVYDAARMVDSYQQYLDNLKNNRFITGIDNIDKAIRGVGGGEVLTILARSGSFKTAMLQNMLKNYVQNSAWGAIFFSIEMPVASVAERYFSILDGCTGREVECMFTDKKMGYAKHAAIEQFKSDLKGLQVITSKISIEDIPAYVHMIQSEKHIKIGVVGIDYIGLMDGDGKDEYQCVSNIARGLKTVAKDINIPIVVLSQVSRKGGDGEVEISLDMGRGSGAIEEGADFVLGLWQVEKKSSPGEYDLVCRILKNRKGFKGGRWKLDLIPGAMQIGRESVEYIPTKSTRKTI